jgi:hypothetical protein
MSRRLFLILSALLPTACATTGAVPRVDLAPAREAVEAARKAGAPERAAEPFGRAQSHLSEAESLTSPGPGDAADRARQAQALAQVATAEAVCARDMAWLATPGQQGQASAAPADADKQVARLHRAEEEQRRLEERVSLLQRELELSETEVARTKARLKGSETKAEASSTIAEARILLRRMADERGRAPALARANELLTKAEQALKEDNYGAASYFALRAQEVATRTPEQQATAASSDAERPAPRKSYQVSSAVANIRKGPSTMDPVVGSAPKGATLEASAIRGEWIKVSYGSVAGWVHRSLVQ